MQRILYYDCFSGISGDMNIGALIGLGVDINYLKSELDKLGIEGYELSTKEDQRNGISGCNFNVNITKKFSDHTHFSQIIDIIQSSKLNKNIKEISLKIFAKIALAESKIHNVPIDKVHFHEVGAVDSIIDIVGAAICLDYLKVDKIISSPIVLGKGFVKCDHGTIPVPAPATLEIVKSLPVIIGDIEFEATTPTGAAILAAIVDEFTSDLNIRVENTAYGIGNKIGKKPNVLRVILGSQEKKRNNKLVENQLLECNIDDMNPENFDFIFDSLFQKGALDVHITTIIMKKSRPAFTLSVLCLKEDCEILKENIFKHTTTIGIKESIVKKHMLLRKTIIRSTPWGEINCKQSFYNGNLLNEKPEYDECKKIASDNDLRLQDIKNYIYANR